MKSFSGAMIGDNLYNYLYIMVLQLRFKAIDKIRQKIKSMLSNIAEWPAIV